MKKKNIEHFELIQMIEIRNSRNELIQLMVNRTDFQWKHCYL